MRRLVAALIILVIVVAAWIGGWFWLAGWVSRKADPTLQEIARRGIEVECPKRTIVGFPFALRVACGETTVAERSTGTEANIAGATGGASLFAPMTARIALKSPVRVNSPRLQGPLELRWKDAAVSLHMGIGGPRNVSFETADFLGAFSVPGLPEETVAAAGANGRLAPSANGGTDLAASFTDLALTTGSTRFPPVSGSASVELSLPPHALATVRDMREPLEARNILVSLESGGARFGVEGDMSIAPGGILDGTITLRVAGAEALPQFIASLPRRLQKIGNAVAAGLYAFGRPTTLDGKPASEVTVTVAGNRAQIGPIEVDLPRLPL
jgi:hypothetical protein